jgi:small conductance mechanosensitive channel
MMNFDKLIEFLSTRGVDMAINLIAAVLIWVIGRWVIKKVTGLVGTSIERAGKLDATLTRYIVSILGVVLTIMLVMFILSRFGIETTSFAALLAGAGLAIGTAWGGLLAHFAAGVFMQVLRPFKVGDYVSAGGVEGTVTEVGLFASTILTPQNVTTIVGNNKIFSDNIQNFSAQPYRRVECTAKINNSVNLADAVVKLRAAVSKVPNIKTTPAPDVELLSFSGEGPVICVRPYCDNNDYWQVLFDTNKAIAETGAANKWPAPEFHAVQRAI